MGEMSKSDSRKEANRLKLLNHLGNPANEWPTRVFMNDFVLGYIKSKQYIYKIFTLEELHGIEQEALAMRRTKYSGGIALVDRALLKAAIEGDVAAAKLCYQRFEDWGEKKEISLPDLKWTTEVIDPKLNEEDKF